MLKFTCGQIANNKTGISKDIVISPLCIENARDILIGSTMIVGGIVYIAWNCFKNGAKAYDLAECQVFEDLDLLAHPENN